MYILSNGQLLNRDFMLLTVDGVFVVLKKYAHTENTYIFLT